MALSTSSPGTGTGSKVRKAGCSRPVSSAMKATADQANMAESGNRICGDRTTRQVMTSTASTDMPSTRPRYSDWRRTLASKAARCQSRMPFTPSSDSSSATVIEDLGGTVIAKASRSGVASRRGSALLEELAAATRLLSCDGLEMPEPGNDWRAASATTSTGRTSGL